MLDGAGSITMKSDCHIKLLITEGTCFIDTQTAPMEPPPPGKYRTVFVLFSYHFTDAERGAQRSQCQRWGRTLLLTPNLHHCLHFSDEFGLHTHTPPQAYWKIVLLRDVTEERVS